MRDVVARACDEDTGRWIEVWVDEFAGSVENPMRDWDWNCQLEIYHRDYEEAGMKHDPSIDYTGGLRLPIRAYEHSGISFSLSSSYPYNDPWDSYEIGAVGMTAKQLKEACDGDKIKAVKYFNDVIATLNAYVNGNIYGFTCYDPDGESVESMGGFYDTYKNVDGIFKDMAENMPTEYEELAKRLSWGQLDPLEVTVTRHVRGYKSEEAIA